MVKKSRKKSGKPTEGWMTSPSLSDLSRPSQSRPADSERRPKACKGKGCWIVADVDTRYGHKTALAGDFDTKAEANKALKYHDNVITARVMKKSDFDRLPLRETKFS